MIFLIYSYVYKMFEILRELEAQQNLKRHCMYICRNEAANLLFIAELNFFCNS
jgi:hypothetical protein